MATQTRMRLEMADFILVTLVNPDGMMFKVIPVISNASRRVFTKVCRRSLFGAFRLIDFISRPFNLPVARHAVRSVPRNPRSTPPQPKT